MKGDVACQAIAIAITSAILRGVQRLCCCASATCLLHLDLLQVAAAATVTPQALRGEEHLAAASARGDPERQEQGAASVLAGYCLALPCLCVPVISPCSAFNGHARLRRHQCLH